MVRRHGITEKHSRWMLEKFQTYSPAQPMRAETLLYPNKAARILSIFL